ncbi:MAG TPA: ADOP family duplicated permease [Gammaproteobacteria bacterium]|nr:ADOP family duplicated permease [Gammaproteobacteria bacterium]
MQTSDLLRSFGRDVRYALRSLRASPWLTTVAVVTLAIGTGAATATFAVVNSVLIKPLPYPEADRLVGIWHVAPGADGQVWSNAMLTSPSMLYTYRDESRVIEQIGLWTAGMATITGDGEPEEVPRIAPTVGTLDALGVPPLLGRWFADDDRQTTILSYEYWQRRFGGDAAVIGRTLTVNTQTMQIIGVMPRGFRIADVEADILMGPMRFERGGLTLEGFNYNGVARLKPGKTAADANADLARLIPIWAASWPPSPGIDARRYTEEWRIAPAARPLKRDVVGSAGELLWVVLATIGVVLAIASANVANLMLIRSAARRHELAIRAALGAGSARLVRGLLLEGIAVGLLAGLLGVGIAAVGLRSLLLVAPANVPRLHEVGLDAGVIAIALAGASLAGLFVGLVSAVRVGGAELNQGLHAGGRTSSEGRGQRRLQQSLAIGQVALVAVVLVCAGLLLRTAMALRAVEPGFTAAEQVQTLRISMRGNQVPDPEVVARRQQAIVNALAALPGASAAAFASSMPMDDLNRLSGQVEIESPGNARGPETSGQRLKFISPQLFAVLGTALRAGRELTWDDLYEDRPVALISENTARGLWGTSAAAIGKRIRPDEDTRWREVVGVVADVREDGLRLPPPSIVYLPTLRRVSSPGAGSEISVTRSVIVAVRSPLAGTEAFRREVQEAVWSVDPNLPITTVRTLQGIYELSSARTTFAFLSLVVAAAASLALGVVGLYGVLSYTVSLRRREIAIRLALGGDQRGVRRRFVRYGVALAGVGIAIGAAAAIGVTRLIASLLYDVQPFDAATYGAVVAGLTLVAALASYLPARRASTVDPAEALAAE